MKKIYGLWDANQIYKVRVVATHPGEWSWINSASNSESMSLIGKTGVSLATEWTGEIVHLT